MEFKKKDTADNGDFYGFDAEILRQELDAIFPNRCNISTAQVTITINPIGEPFTEDEEVQIKNIVITHGSEVNNNYRIALKDCYTKRINEYPPKEDYLDGVVKNDASQIQKYKDDCLTVKAKYPKPPL